MSAPISIPVDIVDTGTAVLQAMAGQFDNLGLRGDNLAQKFGIVERAGGTLQRQFETLTKVAEAFTRQTDLLAKSQGSLADAFGLTGDAADALSKKYGLTVDSTDSLISANQRMIGSLADGNTMLAARATALQAVIDKQTIVATTSNLGSVGGGGASIAARTEQSNLERASRILGTGVAAQGGLGGRILGAALGPEGLATLGAGYVGYKAGSDASTFWSNLAQSGAQSGTTNPGGILSNPSALRGLGQNILNYGASGKDPYNVSLEASGIEPLLAHGYSVNAIEGALPTVAQFSAQNKAPDLSNTVAMINTLAALQGSGPNSTAAQLKSFADFGSRAEQLTTIPPGQLNTALPRLLASLTRTGVGAADATGLLIKAGTANPSARLDSTAISRLISDIAVKPTAGAVQEADKLGMGIGPGAIQAYGGIYGYLQALSTAIGTGPNATQSASKIFTQTNALQGYNELLAGGGLSQAAGYTTGLKNADGTTANAFGQLSQGTQQQATQLMNRFNADMTTMGTTINDKVVPQLLKLASASLTLGEGFAKALADIANQDNAWNKWMEANVPGYRGAEVAFMGNDTGPAPKPSASGSALIARTMNPNNLANLPGYTGPAYVTPGSSGGVSLPSGFMGPLAPGESRGDTSSAPLITHPNAAVDAMTRENRLRAQGYGIDSFVAAQHAALMKPKSAADRDQAVRDDRSILNTLLLNGATAGQASQQLAVLRGDLPGSAYSSAQQGNIYAQESGKVNTYNRGLAGIADQNKVNDAQSALTLAQSFNQTPAQLKKIFDEYLAAEKQLAEDTLSGRALSKQLGVLAQSGAVFSNNQRLDAVQQQLADLGYLQQAAGLNGNTALANRYGKQALGINQANAHLLSLDPAQLTLLQAQYNSASKIVTPGPQLIRSQESGLGDSLLGAGSGADTIARLSQSGGQDPLAKTVQRLEAMIRYLERQLTEEEKTNDHLADIKDELSASGPTHRGTPSGQPGSPRYAFG